MQPNSGPSFFVRYVAKRASAEADATPWRVKSEWKLHDTCQNTYLLLQARLARLILEILENERVEKQAMCMKTSARD